MFKIKILILLLVQAFFAGSIYGQMHHNNFPLKITRPQISMDGYGASVALHQGRYTFVEMGVEKYWSQLKLINARTTAVSLGLIYNPFKNIGGINGNIWTRKGRLSFTYGASAGYYSDFAASERIAFGPALGYRLLGLHLVGGFNFLLGDNNMTGVNNVYASARYYLPLERDFDMK